MGNSETEAIIEEEYSVGSHPAFSLDTVSGRATIRCSDVRGIRVHARKYGRPEAVQNTHIEFSLEGDLLTVHTRGKRRGIGVWKSVCAVDFDIWVPRGCRLSVNTVSAAVDIQGVGATAAVTTVSGSIGIDSASDVTSITTVSGDVTGRSLEGKLQLMSVSASSAIWDSRLSDFDVESVSGSVELETELFPTGRFRVKTVSGEISLHIPDGTGITVHVGSISGRINSALQTSLEAAGFGRWQGKINGGGAELRLESVSGNVTIERARIPMLT